MSVITKITMVPPTTPIFPASVSDLLSWEAVKKLGVAVNSDRHCTELCLQARESPQEGRDDV